MHDYDGVTETPMDETEDGPSLNYTMSDLVGMSGSQDILSSSTDLRQPFPGAVPMSKGMDLDNGVFMPSSIW